MSRIADWTRQVVGHAPAVAAGFAVVFADSVPLAAAWLVASRLAYVLFVGLSLRAEARRGALSRRAGPEAAWERFRRRASWLMDNDAVAFAALCVVSAGTLVLGTPVWVTAGAGLCLVAVGVGVKVWAAASLAPGSYHWRNFFLPPTETAISAAGPYRWLSNPMYTVGYAHAYGLALVLRSAHGLAAAAFAQAAILVLLFVVERPHFGRLAARRGRADAAAEADESTARRDAIPLDLEREGQRAEGVATSVRRRNSP